MAGQRLTCTRRLEFDAGHRLVNHESKCRNVHGHRYVAEITVGAEALDDVGRVVDFGEIKRVVGTWIDDVLDHGYIGQQGDPVLDLVAHHGWKLHAVTFPPTAENLAAYILEASQRLLGPRFVVERVRLYETPNGYADAEPRR